MHVVFVGLPRSLDEFVIDKLSRSVEGTCLFSVPANDSKGWIFEDLEIVQSGLSKAAELACQEESMRKLAVVTPSKSFGNALNQGIGCSLPVAYVAGLEFGYTSRQTRKAVVTRTSKILVEALRELNGFLKELSGYLSVRQSCPLLLPDEHFESRPLASALVALSKINLLAGGLPDLGSLRNNLKRDVKHRSDGKKRFIDDRGAVFNTPGRALHGHTYPPENQDPQHLEKCHLASRFRLGCSIDGGFHYDCEGVTGRGGGELLSCHRQPVGKAGASYLNIYPNNFVRVPSR